VLTIIKTSTTLV